MPPLSHEETVLESQDWQLYSEHSLNVSEMELSTLQEAASSSSSHVLHVANS